MLPTMNLLLSSMGFTDQSQVDAYISLFKQNVTKDGLIYFSIENQ